MDLWTLSATEAALGIRNGEFSSQDLVGACLKRIDELEPTLGAWAYLDPDHALQLARGADESRASGAGTGPLHGVPVGVKDIFDTRDMPTECGTPVFAGRQPNVDAQAVSLLREAGAIVIGKTVTTEVAAYAPGKTANPIDPTRTPGGSSSGSAAAVAAGMVPLAIGSQTNGSMIRPGSYCGVYAYKPTFGAMSRRGVLAQSRPLDTLGVFARTVEDLALIAEPLMAYDERDPDMMLKAQPRLCSEVSAEPPVEPHLGFVKSPVWDQASDDCQETFAELAEFLGEGCDEVALPAPFENAVRWHRTVMYADFAKSFATLYETGKQRLSDVLCGMIEEGQSCLAVDYNRAIDMADVLNAGLDQVFERYDAVITPAATGEAPVGLESTGSPVFCTLWTFFGVPAITLPRLTGRDGMPIGVQLVGRRNDDARLLRTARWLAEKVANAA